MKELKVGTDFTGIGAPEQALKNLKIKHRNIFACDVDKYAKQTFLSNNNPETFYDDITKRDHSKVEQLDLYVAGFPCQAFSMAGNRKGFDDVRGTLFFNVAEFIQINQPECFILENVKGLLSHDNGRTFQTIIDVLSNCGGTVNDQMSLDLFDDGLGYHIKHQVLNTKEHGIPQNRERIFIVGFKKNRCFSFPKQEQLKLKLKDLLEDNVSEKYYLKKKMLKTMILEKKNNVLKVKSATNRGYEEARQGDSINFSVPSSKTRRGRVGKGVAQTLDTACNQGVIGGKWNDFKNNKGDKKGFEPLTDGCSPSLLARARNDGSGMAAVSINHDVRRLTPLECMRLQNFPDEFVKPCSDTQIYKQAGNSMTVRVIQKIIDKIYKKM